MSLPFDVSPKNVEGSLILEILPLEFERSLPLPVVFDSEKNSLLLLSEWLPLDLLDFDWVDVVPPD